MQISPKVILARGKVEELKKTDREGQVFRWWRRLTENRCRRKSTPRIGRGLRGEVKMSERVFPNRGGWETVVKNNGDGTYETVIRNTDPETGHRRFYEASTVGSQYGNPVVVEEPDAGISARELGLPHDCRIVGIVVVEAGRVIDRFSISDAEVMQGRSVSADFGALRVNAETLWVVALVDSNRLRIDGTIAVCTRTPPQGDIPLLEAVDDLFPYALVK